MSARVPEAPPCSIEQIWSTITTEEHMRVAIDNALRALNGHSDRVERVYERMFKGRTHNDRRFIAKFLRHMFGLRKQDGKTTTEPLHPEFGYIGPRRMMSMNALQKLLKKKYPRAHPSYDQLRRIFDGFKDLDLLVNVECIDRDEQGRVTEESSYIFDLKRWEEVWKDAEKPTPFKPAKKRTCKEKVNPPDHAVKPRHRPSSRRDEYLPTEDEASAPGKEVEKSAANPFAFGGSPCGLTTHTCSLNREGLAEEPGQAGQVLEQVGKLKDVPLLEEKSRGGIGSTQVDPTPLSSFQNHPPVRKAPGEEIQEFSYTPVQPFRLWQDFLESWLFDKTGGNAWQKHLYLPVENPKTGQIIQLKPRVPDCLVNPVASLSCPAGVWDKHKHFLPLLPAELELGDLVERFSGCPLRMRDWKSLSRQFHGKAGTRLTKDRLLLTVFAACRELTTYGSTVNGRTCTILDVVPELDARNFGPYSGHYDWAMADDERYNCGRLADVLRSNCEDEKLKALDAHRVFPFLHYAVVAPAALLSPDNAGKMLANWHRFWKELVLKLLPETHRMEDGRLHLAWAARQLTRYGIKDTHQVQPTVMPAEVEAVLADMCDTFRADREYHGLDLWPTLRTVKKEGLGKFSNAVRQMLTEVALNIYCRAPHHWCDLDAELGAKFMAQLLPVSNLAVLRQTAHQRTREKLISEWVLPYAKFSPAHYIG